MIKQSVTIDEAVAFLNLMLSLDRRAVTEIVEARVRCNRELADADDVQCAHISGHDRVGPLGVINGFFGTDEETGYGPIMAVVGDGGFIDRFERIDWPRKVDVLIPYLPSDE